MPRRAQEEKLVKKYWLRQWVYAAISDEHLVFLDVLRDKYYLIPCDEARLVYSVIVQDGEEKADVPSEEIEPGCEPKSIEQMVENGLITDKPEAGKPFSQCSILPPVDRFEHTESDEEPKVCWHHVVSAFLTGLLVHIALRFMPLRLIIKLLSRSKVMPNPEECERTGLKLAALYRLMRPFLYRSRLCLYDTIAFASFCRIYGFSPTIVFGVKGEPFEAHCWAQWGALVLNDSPQNTGQYTPIMAV